MLRDGSLPVELAGRPFTTAEARAAGVTARVLQNRALRRPFAGVRVAAELDADLVVHCRAAALALPRRAAFSHETAAALLRLPLPARSTQRDPVRASVPTGSVVPRLAGVRVSEGLDPATVVDVRGLPVVGASRTWCDLAPGLGDLDALVLGDAVVTRAGGPRDLVLAVASRRGRRDVVRLRSLVARTRHPVRSPGETRWRLLVAAAGVPEPRFNQPVLDRAGTWIAVPDLQWPEVRVASEYDGLHHYRDERQWRDDVLRKELMEDEGWRVLRVTRDDLVLRPHRTVDRLWCVLHQRGLPGLPPRP